MKKYGLIGKKLSHSFSEKYFSEKFEKEGIDDARYDLYEIESIEKLPELIKYKSLSGLNVTIPYKKEVIPYLDELDSSADIVGAVNVIRIQDNKLTGFNSDYYGFITSLLNWYKGEKRSMVLGTGGAAAAVVSALKNNNFSVLSISRTRGDFTYEELKKSKETIKTTPLIINTTPLGMVPNTENFPDIDYSCLSSNHYLYDLVYNPKETAFMKKGIEKQAKAKNGLEMLILQAEKSWEIWQNY